ncbi:MULTISPECIES: hypothetical protein [Chryseobacterium]|uniref:Uncharacterized protein n=1 Tax=Chryseobacterium endophyticum TaxID=1854762 RepID=A0AAU6WKA5_9FLAO|nr:hypothetical protein [uncultured Chryseobacterium sp.]
MNTRNSGNRSRRTNSDSSSNLEEIYQLGTGIMMPRMMKIMMMTSRNMKIILRTKITMMGIMTT